MSSKVTKSPKRKPPSFSLVNKNRLLDHITDNSVTMPSYTNCQMKGRSTCQYLETNSSRCDECVRSNRSMCDVRGVLDTHFQQIASHYSRLEDEIVVANAEAQAALQRVQAALQKANRLRQRKKDWQRRLSNAIARGVDNLTAVAEEEGAAASMLGDKEDEAAAAPAAEPTSSPFDPNFATSPPVPAPDFSSFSAFVTTLDPSEPMLWADPGFSGGTPAPSVDNSSNSQLAPSYLTQALAREVKWRRRWCPTAQWAVAGARSWIWRRIF